MANCGDGFWNGCGNAGSGDCGPNFVRAGCINPCKITRQNTPECETLPSQISNFTHQFFGDVTKTEIDGKVTWILPCNLETGLPANPRHADEGLACYYLRLFQDGIIGLTGPQGAPGVPGANGDNAFTISLQGFNQPTLASPFLNLNCVTNPAILTGLYVFIEGSGWFLVNGNDGAGTLFLQLVKELPGAPAHSNAGKLVVPSGFPGESIIGPAGPTGPTGPAGTPGASFTATNGQTFVNIGTDFQLQIVSGKVTFSGNDMSVTLPATGTYLLTATVALESLDFTSGGPNVSFNDVIAVKLRDTHIAGDIAASFQQLNNFDPGEKNQITISVLYTSQANFTTVQLWGSCTTADVVNVIRARTSLHYVRLA
jgi:hypothetical protein